jgi:hypothetical protein
MPRRRMEPYLWSKFAVKGSAAVMDALSARALERGW